MADGSTISAGAAEQAAGPATPNSGAQAVPARRPAVVAEEEHHEAPGQAAAGREAGGSGARAMVGPVAL